MREPLLIDLGDVLSPIHRAAPSPIKKNAPGTPKEEAKGGVLREVFETIGGVTGGVAQVAASALPSALVGAKEGFAKARDPERTIDPKRIARQVTIGTAAQALVPSATVGYFVSGVKGATVAFTGQAVGGAAGIVLFSEGGAADLIGENIAQDLERTLDGETSVGKGFVKGAYAGLKGGVSHNFKAGYQEGEGLFSGLVEGTQAVPQTIRDTGRVSLKGSWMMKAAQMVAGTAAAALAVPAGITQGVVHSFGKSELGPVKRAAYTAGGLALAAAGWPLAVGMVGPALCSAGAAAVVGLTSSLLAGKRTEEEVPKAVDKAKLDNKPLDEEIAVSRQNMYEGALVGAAAAGTVGWDKGVKLLGGQAQKTPESSQ